MSKHHRAFIDLFAGAGGASTGLRAAGLKHAVGVELSPTYAETYARNNGDVICGDVAQVTKAQLQGYLAPGKKLFLLWASPVCHSFSSIGQRREDDARDDLYAHVIRIASELRPRWIVMENVVGILSKIVPRRSKTTGGRVQHSAPARVSSLVPQASSYAEVMMQALQEIGYATRVQVMNAAHYGVPQNRRRAIFIATVSGLPISFPPPVTGVDVSVGRCLLPRSSVPDKYWLSRHRLAVFTERTRRNVAKGIGFRMQLLDPAKPSYTLTASYGTNFGYYALVAYGKSDVRMLTPGECAAIQGFPADYDLVGSDYDKYSSVNNSVPPPLAYAVAKHILSIEESK
jgi:DNA (cytosine-5)-methyltransferase 1